MRSGSDSATAATAEYATTYRVPRRRGKGRGRERKEQKGFIKQSNEVSPPFHTKTHGNKIDIMITRYFFRNVKDVASSYCVCLVAAS